MDGETARRRAKKLVTSSSVAGWIAIPGMEQPCPLARGGEGPAVLENAGDWSVGDFHTVVRAGGAASAALKNYKKPDYWREHPCVYVVLDADIYRYDVFSAHGADADGLAFRPDIEEPHSEEEFLRYCRERSAIDAGIAPEPGDRVLTLSAGDGAGRWAVHGVLAREYSRRSCE